MAVFAGVLFWWYLWGVAGAFLAVPFFAALEIVGDHVEGLAPIATFLGRRAMRRRDGRFLARGAEERTG